MKKWQTALSRVKCQVPRKNTFRSFGTEQKRSLAQIQYDNNAATAWEGTRACTSPRDITSKSRIQGDDHEAFVRRHDLEDTSITGAYKKGTHILPQGPYNYPDVFEGGPLNRVEVKPDNRDPFYFGHNPNPLRERLLDWIMFLGLGTAVLYYSRNFVVTKNSRGDSFRKCVPITPEEVRRKITGAPAATEAAQDMTATENIKIIPKAAVSKFQLTSSASNDYANVYMDDTISKMDTKTRINACLGSLKAGLGEGKIFMDENSREAFLQADYSYHTGGMPCAIIEPESTEDVALTLKTCMAYNVAVVPTGARTSLEGQTVVPADRKDIVILNLAAMDKVVGLNTSDMTVTVQAGVRWMDLNSYLMQNTPYFFPMDPGPGASIGGMMGTCCGGTNAVQYGVMRDWVLSATVVLADGRILKLGTPTRKNVAGYDLLRLIIGSEGTLGVVTDAVLKLAPRPTDTAVAICAFASTEAACGAVTEAMRRGVHLGGAEFLDALSMQVVNSGGGFSFPEKPTVMFRCTGTATEVAEAMDILSEVAKQNEALHLERRTCESDGKSTVEKLWSVRKDLLLHCVAWAGSKQPWITDVCVPLGSLPAAIADIEQLTLASSLDVPIFGHAGDGNVHGTILFDPSNPLECQEAERLSEMIVRIALAHGGTCTGEHGIGSGKRHCLQKQLTPEVLRTMRDVKHLFDPTGILNPGKIFFD